MFKNKSVQVSLVNKPQPSKEATYVDDTDFNDKAVVLGVVAEGVVKKIGIVVVSYIAMDTIRQVVIARAKAGA